MDHINCLPEEVLIEIFGYLSPKLIKSCTLVCKRWNEIVGNSLDLMSKFQLYFDENQTKKERPVMRRYQTAVIKKLTATSIEAISQYNLQSLTINYANKRKLSTLIDVLNYFPMLKVFNAKDLTYIDDITEDSDCMKVRINLEELRCAVDILHIFDCTTLKVLELKWDLATNLNKNRKAMMFLKQQTDLKDFKLYGFFSKEFFDLPEIFELQFSLQTLSCNSNLRDVDHEKFINFLDAHKKTLTSLDLKNFYTGSSRTIKLIHKFALENLSNLKDLKLGCAYTEYINLTFNGMPLSPKIESLGLTARSRDMNENKRFMAMFPNLKHLDFKLDDIQLLHQISLINVNLESLTIHRLQSEDFPHININFPKLKEFSVQRYWNHNALCSFINRHSKTLESITLRFLAISKQIAEEIINCGNLKFVEYHDYLPSFSSNKVIMNFFNEISLKPKPCRLILVDTSFIFPDDKGIWDEHLETISKKKSKKP